MAAKAPARYDGGPLDGQVADSPTPPYIHVGATLTIRLDAAGSLVEPGEPAAETHVYVMRRGPVWKWLKGSRRA